MAVVAAVWLWWPQHGCGGYGWGVAAVAVVWLLGHGSRGRGMVAGAWQLWPWPWHGCCGRDMVGMLVVALWHCTGGCGSCGSGVVVVVVAAWLFLLLLRCCLVVAVAVALFSPGLTCFLSILFLNVMVHSIHSYLRKLKYNC